MTTRGGDVRIIVTAEDRASPVMARVSRNVGRLQTNMVSLGRATGALRGQLGGVLGPMGSMIGTMGPAAFAITGVGLALSFGINKLRAWQAENKKTSQSAENLRNKLMLSGFSAAGATTAVDELRGSLSRLVFNILPKLDDETQGFIINMDRVTRRSFDDIVQNLKKLGIAEEAAAKAVAEAMQGNFGPISQLLRRPISTMEEFGRVTRELKATAVASGNEIVRIFERIATGALPVQDGVRELQATIASNVRKAANTFTEHGGVIVDLLNRMSETERQYVIDNALNLESTGENVRALQFAYGREFGIIEGVLKQATGVLMEQIGAQIKALEGLAPAWAAAFRNALEGIQGDAAALFELLALTNAAVVQISQARTRGVATGGAPFGVTPSGAGGPSGTPVGGGRSAIATATGPGVRFFAGNLFSSEPLRGFQHGAIVTRPVTAQVGEVPEMIAPLSRLPALLEGMNGRRPIVVNVQIGEQVVRDMVVTVLNDEVALREPSLGLG